MLHRDFVVARVLDKQGVQRIACVRSDGQGDGLACTRFLLVNAYCAVWRSNNDDAVGVGEDSGNNDVGGGHRKGAFCHIDLTAPLFGDRQAAEPIALIGCDGQGHCIACMGSFLIRSHSTVDCFCHSHSVVDGLEGRGDSDVGGGHGELIMLHRDFVVARVLDKQGVQRIACVRSDGQGDGIPEMQVFRWVGSHGAVFVSRNRYGEVDELEGGGHSDIGCGHGELIVRHIYSLVLAVGYSQCVQLPALVGRDGQGDGVARMG